LALVETTLIALTQHLLQEGIKRHRNIKSGLWGSLYMDNMFFVFIINIVGGIALFILLTLLLSIIGGTMDTPVLIGTLLFIQLSFVSTLLFKVLSKMNK